MTARVLLLALALGLGAPCAGVPAAAGDTPVLRLFQSAFSSGCWDRNGANPSRIDTYTCDVAPDTHNELFNYSEVDGLIRCGTGVAACVSAAPCSTGSFCAVACDTSDAMQVWSYAPASRAFSLRASPTQCATAGGAGAINALVLRPCNASLEAQQWQFGPPVRPTALNLTLNARAPWFRFDGLGLLSAGASSRLLQDYVEPQRSQVLDYLFRPRFGAALSAIKVEIGGDCQSTSGTEASHMHARGDLDCGRGYEGWLLAEARKRNPGIKTWGLSWGVPRWIGNGSFFSADNVAYQTAWVSCMQTQYGIGIDYIGIWNERDFGPLDYTIRLRQSLDSAGYTNTKIVLPDLRISQRLVDALNFNASFSSSVYAVGEHGCGHKTWTNGSFDQPFWCTENEVSNGWDAAQSWGGTPGGNFVAVNQTSTTAWSLIWSVYPNVQRYQSRGAARAQEPWSGHYVIDPTIWMYAHWTQFVPLGWQLLAPSSNSSGVLPGGNYVCAVSPDGGDFSLMVSHLYGNSDTAVAFSLLGGFPTAKPLQLWATSQNSFFTNVANLTVDPDAVLRVTLHPNTMYSMTTLPFGTVAHGNFSTPVPPSAPFPFPYAEDFEGYAPTGKLAKYFGDQGGSFEVQTLPDGNGVLVQMAPADPGPNGWVRNAEPTTMIGGNWTTIQVQVSARVPSSNASRGLAAGRGLLFQPCTAGQPNQEWTFNTPAPAYLQNALSADCLNIEGCGRNARVLQYMCEHTPGGSSCPPSGYGNLEWRLFPDQTLRVNVTGQCATVTGLPDPVVQMADCNPASTPEQLWTYDQATKQLQAQSNKMCLSAAPKEEYIKVCGRVVSYVAFQDELHAACLVVNQSHWRISEFEGVRLAGPLPAQFRLGDWHTLGLNLTGPHATALLDRKPVGTATVAVAPGSTALGSGYHPAHFDNFSVSA